MKLEEIIDSGRYNAFLNVKESITNGIAFLYPSWSIDQRYLVVLLERLKLKNINSPLFIYNLDDESSEKFQKHFSVLSQGKGEIYFIKEGVILLKIEKHDKLNPEKQIDSMLEDIQRLK